MTESEFKLLCENVLIFIVNILLAFISLFLVVISRIHSILSYWSIKCSKNINNKILELSEQTQYIKFKKNIRNTFENIRNNIINFINTVTWYPVQDNVFNDIETKFIYEFNNEDPFKDIPFWVLPMVPPSYVLLFGKHIFDKNYKKDMYDKYPMYTVEEIINSLLGDNLEFPSYEKWLESKYDDDADDEAEEETEDEAEETEDEADDNTDNSDEGLVVINMEQPQQPNIIEENEPLENIQGNENLWGTAMVNNATNATGAVGAGVVAVAADVVADVAADVNNDDDLPGLIADSDSDVTDKESEDDTPAE